MKASKASSETSVLKYLGEYDCDSKLSLSSRYMYEKTLMCYNLYFSLLSILNGYRPHFGKEAKGDSQMAY